MKKEKKKEEVEVHWMDLLDEEGTWMLMSIITMLVLVLTGTLVQGVFIVGSIAVVLFCVVMVVDADKKPSGRCFSEEEYQMVLARAKRGSF